MNFTPAFGLGFAGTFGINYFISPAFSVFAEQVIWPGTSDTMLGVRLKLG